MLPGIKTVSIRFVDGAFEFFRELSLFPLVFSEGVRKCFVQVVCFLVWVKRRCPVILCDNPFLTVDAGQIKSGIWNWNTSHHAIHTIPRVTSEPTPFSCYAEHEYEYTVRGMPYILALPLMLAFPPAP